jgi:hypothetical protein
MCATHGDPPAWRFARRVIGGACAAAGAVALVWTVADAWQQGRLGDRLLDLAVLGAETLGPVGWAVAGLTALCFGVKWLMEAREAQAWATGHLELLLRRNAGRLR